MALVFSILRFKRSVWQFFVKKSSSIVTCGKEEEIFTTKISILHILKFSWSFFCFLYSFTGGNTYHHHHVTPSARTPWLFLVTLLYRPLLLAGLHPVSAQSCCMSVLAGCPAFARPCEGVHWNISLMSSSLHLQQCSACLAPLTLIVFVMAGKLPYSCYLVGCCLQDLFNISSTDLTDTISAPVFNNHIIMWLIVSSLSPHSLHLLSCCVLSILVLIWLVLMALSCTAIRRDSVSLLRFPFLSQVQVLWCEMFFIRRLKRP